jgi:hypothetical protein
MNIKVNEACKIAKNAYVMYVYSIQVHLSILEILA